MERTNSGDIIGATEAESSEKTSALRAKLESATDKAREVCNRLQEKTAAAARAADKTVRDHPYHAIGVAFGLGLLVGVLAMRSRKD